jgi:hypothetical protein
MRDYRLSPTMGYQIDLREIAGSTSHLEDDLRRSIYLTLEREPQRGQHHRASGLWIIRKRMVLGLLLIQIAYRIDEDKRVVQLVSARVIDQSLM